MTSCQGTQMPSYSPTVDITSLLRSWCPPERIDEVTMTQIQLNIVALDNLVQPRLDRIREFKSEIARLRAEVAVISPTLEKFHSLYAPIRRLPPELLQSVFGHLEPGPMPSKDDAPWLLTKVCSSWRDLAVHTPTLWSTIKIDCPFGWWFLPKTWDPSALLTCSLRYSNNAPLDVTIASHRDIPTTDHIIILLKRHSTRWRSLVAGSGVCIPNNLPVLEKLDLRISWGRFDTLRAPLLHTLILGKLDRFPFSRFPSLRYLECCVVDGAQLIALLGDAKQLTSLRVVCWGRSDPETLPSPSITSNLLELHLPAKVPKALSCISFSMLHSLTLGLPACCYPAYTQTDVDILNNLHCPRLRTLILNEPVGILSLNKLLSYPITRLDLVVRQKSMYSALKSTPLLNLEDLRITDNSPLGSEEMLMAVKAKKSLRNVEVKSASFERIRKLFRAESFPEELTIRCRNAPAQMVRPRICEDGSSRDAVVV
ncbi:hypothetical protein EDD18DRAFT_1465391 [Armillaria luteobubalina]|uniref:F-box domain-containing protein n=1 Tax=Armillaria luteobubalina TaxID=153913 RepID=A0AA39PZF1_9AGAR|nr:hypothetical protein EDD18DRAFT_1465391 [Armillaria luteobubalina]